MSALVAAKALSCAKATATHTSTPPGASPALAHPRPQRRHRTVALAFATPAGWCRQEWHHTKSMRITHWIYAVDVHASTPCFHCMRPLHASTACLQCMLPMHASSPCFHCMLPLHASNACLQCMLSMCVASQSAHLTPVQTERRWHHQTHARPRPTCGMFL